MQYFRIEGSESWCFGFVFPGTAVLCQVCGMELSGPVAYALCGTRGPKQVHSSQKSTSPAWSYHEKLGPRSQP